MGKFKITYIAIFILMILISFSGCGEITSNTIEGNNAGNNSPAVTSISGVAASGLPVSGIVSVTDANGVTNTVTITDKGAFIINVKGLTPPFIVCADGTVMDRPISICSVALEGGTTNITPVTDLILRNVVGVATGNAKANWQAISASVTGTAVTEMETKVEEQLAPILQAAGVIGDVDLISTPFDADMTGLDLMLDGIDITYDATETIATITNNFDDTNTITDDITTTSDNESNQLENSIVASEQFITDNRAINSIWDKLEAIYSSGLPTSEELSAFFESHVSGDFTDNAGTPDDLLLAFSSGQGWPIVNGTISSIINSPVNNSDLGPFLKGHWVYVSVSAEGQVSGFLTSVGWDGLKWHWRGNRKLKWKDTWLPDTGQTTSHTSIFGEDSDYNNGPPMKFSDNGNGTVTDMNTGLTWQQQDDGILRTFGVAGVYCKNLTLGGYSDWSLPTPPELETIYDYGANNIHSSLTINSDKIWSNRLARFDEMSGMGDAINLSIIKGDRFRIYSDADFAEFSSLCVRGTMPRAFDLTDNGNGTIMHTSTGLIWQQNEDGIKRTWEDSVKYCQDLTLAGNDNWRLPNSREFMTIAIDRTVYSGMMDPMMEPEPLYGYLHSLFTSSLDRWAVPSFWTSTYNSLFHNQHYGHMLIPDASVASYASHSLCVKDIP